MVLSNNLWTGHLTTSIRELVFSHEYLFKAYRYVLITLIDSNNDLGSLWAQSPSIKNLDVDVKCLGAGAVTSVPGFFKLIGGNVSNGFDEYWFYLNKPEIAKPDGCSLNCPPDFPDDFPLIMPWFIDSKCELGIADGIGLTYISRDRESARIIENGMPPDKDR